MTGAAEIALHAVGHDYQVDAQRVHALADVDLELFRCELTAITGPSGSGKSTLLNIMGALMRPTRGHVRIGDTEVDSVDDRALRALRAARLGFVHQRFHLIDHLTTSQNVLVALRYTLLPPVERRARVEEALDTVGLGHRRDHRPSQLSGGEQQRVAIARALANRPRIVIADEPTGNLDRTTGASILRLLKVATETATVIVATHDDEVVRVADRLLRLRDGRVA